MRAKSIGSSPDDCTCAQSYEISTDEDQIVLEMGTDGLAGMEVDILQPANSPNVVRHECRCLHGPELNFAVDCMRRTAARFQRHVQHDVNCSAGTIEDFEAEIERLISLGATIAWEEQFPPDAAAHYRNVVLRDPEGNEFCLGAGVLPS